MSDHIELKRQLDQIQWIEKFIKYEYDVIFVWLLIGPFAEWFFAVLGPPYEHPQGYHRQYLWAIEDHAWYAGGGQCDDYDWRVGA